MRLDVVFRFRADLTSIVGGRHAGAPPEAHVETGLAREADRERDVEQRQLGAPQQLLGPLDSRFVTPSILGLAMPTGISQAAVGTPVLKVGRTTQLTGGVVLSVNATIAVGYGASGIGAFHHQIITTAMAAGGDSGSLLMDRELRAVGLLFAGSAVITIFNHIADVEVALGVRPLTSTR